jgi:UDP-N-acetyl-D-mannosaminuronic acid transferase (WecB/TagA/CpsF family)
MSDATVGQDDRTILGIRFFQGTAQEAIQRVQSGGLVVVPAAPALIHLGMNAGYRESLLDADLVIADSAFMVLVWNWLQRDSIVRLSGLTYLRELLKQPDVREPGSCVWIMSSAKSAKRNLNWLSRQRIIVPESSVYKAPIYSPGTGGGEIHDAALLEMLERERPKHIVLTLGGGTQERLGSYLKRNLSYKPSIHCIGAAIAFLSGDQVHIPVWADRYYLGWLFRSLSEPRRYVPRYWEARRLFGMLRRYRDQMPSATD